LLKIQHITKAETNNHIHRQHTNLYEQKTNNESTRREAGTNKYLKLVVFGFFVWLIPFLVSFGIVSLRTNNRPLFESIMPVVVTFCVVLFAFLYFKKREKNSIKEGFVVGIVWFLISIIIDLAMFLPESAWHMTIADYFMDVGLTYLIILMIPIGFGSLLNKT
jgi:FtsH-binding integral membrane protein